MTLFAVLPGPLEPLQTVDALLATARELARELVRNGAGCQGHAVLAAARRGAARRCGAFSGLIARLSYGAS